MKTIKQSILTIIIGLALAAGISFAAGSFSGPFCDPTGCNTETPINVGSAPQAKSGGLTIGSSSASATPLGGLQVVGAGFFGGLTSFTGLATFNAGIRIPTNAAPGRVLTSDATGTASWGTPFPKPDFIWSEVLIQGEVKSKCPVPNFTTYELETAVIILDGRGEDGSIHQANFGTDDSTGGSWFGLRDGCLSVKRGGNDSAVNDNKKWKSFRLRIWKVAQ